MPRDLFADIPAQPAQKQPRDLFAAEGQGYSGSILPFSRDAQGNVSFDSNAGILGTIKRAVTLPGDVYTGKTPIRDADGNLSNEVIERSFDLAGVSAPVNPAVRAGDAAIPGPLMAARQVEPPAPSAEALKAAAQSGYQQARDMDVQYSSGAIKDLATRARTDLEQDGILSTLAPKTFNILDQLQSPPPGSTAPLTGVEAARRSFGHAAGDFSNPTERLAAQRVREVVDAFIEEPDAASVVAGPAAEAGRLQKDARANYAASQRSARLSGVEDAAELRAAAANSGQNSDNAIRQRIVSLLLDPKKSAGYTDDEIGGLEIVARGTAGRNAARYVGNLLGGGGGLGGYISGSVGAGAGAVAGGVPGAILGAAIPAGIGAASKKTGNYLTARAFKQVDEMTRKRSPLYEQMQKDAGIEGADLERRMAIVRALLGVDKEGR